MKAMKDETSLGQKINLFVNNEIANLQNQFMEQKKKIWQKEEKRLVDFSSSKFSSSLIES
jgi:hypothetical protein